MASPTEAMRDRLIVRQSELEAELVLVNSLLDVYKKNGSGPVSKQGTGSGGVSATLQERVYQYVVKKAEADPGATVTTNEVQEALGVAEGSASKALSTLAQGDDAKLELVADRIPGRRGVVYQYGIKAAPTTTNDTPTPAAAPAA